MNNIGQKLLLVCKLMIGFTLVSYLLNQINYDDFLMVFKQLRVRFFWIGLLFFLLSMVFEVGKLFSLIYKSETVVGTTKIIYIGSFFNNFLPSNIGGDAYKILALGRKHGNWLKWSVLVMADRAVGLFLLVVIPIILFAIYPTRLLVPFSSLIHLPDFLKGERYFLGICGVMLIIIFSCGWRKKLISLSATLVQGLQSANAWQYVLTIVFSSLFHLSRLAGLYYLLQALGSKTAISEIMVAMALAAIVSVFPISIGALGVREGAFVMGLGLYGVNFTTAAAIAMLVRVILWVQAVVGGIIVLFSKQQEKESVG